MTKMLQYAVRHRWAVTSGVLVLYLALAVTVAPPFTTLVQYDEELSQSLIVDAIGLALFVAPLVITFILFLHFRVLRKDEVEPSSQLLKLDHFCEILWMAGWHIWLISHACIAIVHRGTPVWHFWAGQFVGLIGVELLVLTMALWRIAKLYREANGYGTSNKKMERYG